MKVEGVKKKERKIIDSIYHRNYELVEGKKKRDKKNFFLHFAVRKIKVRLSS